MTLRGIPGALALGLLASLIAHSTLYGADHAMGGAYHGILVELAAAGCGGFLMFLGGLAWTGAGWTADGSILAARLACKLPGGGALVGAAAFWFVLGERIEPRHADAGVAITLVAIAAAAWSLLALARWVVRLLARAVVAVARAPFAQRAPSFAPRFEPAPVAARSPFRRRLFARPPPVANACA